MTIGDWLMATAILFFWLSALVKGFVEGQSWLALALALVGGANAILMTLSNAKPQGPQEPPGASVRAGVDPGR